MLRSDLLGCGTKASMSSILTIADIWVDTEAKIPRNSIRHRYRV